MHSDFPRFLATISFHSENHRKRNVVTFSHAIIDRVGQTEIERVFVERGIVCYCRCQYSFTLVSLVRLTFRLYEV